MMARLTGLEPATPGVTGRYSNQLSYNRTLTTPSTIARWGSGDLRGPIRRVKAGIGKNRHDATKASPAACQRRTKVVSNSGMAWISAAVSGVTKKDSVPTRIGTSLGGGSST